MTFADHDQAAAIEQASFRKGLLILGCAVLLQLAGLYVFHASIARVISVQMVVFAATAASLIAIAMTTRPGTIRTATTV